MEIGRKRSHFYSIHATVVESTTEKIGTKDHSVCSLFEIKVSIELSRLDKDIREAINSKRRTMAMVLLKTKKTAENVRNQRLNSLMTLDNIVLRIEQAHTDQEVRTM
jgi:hypothetical protein